MRIRTTVQKSSEIALDDILRVFRKLAKTVTDKVGWQPRIGTSGFEETDT